MAGIKIKNFSTYAEAELVKGYLEKNGIRSWIQMGNLTAGRGGFGGDADLFVEKEKAELANEILDNEE